MLPMRTLKCMSVNQLHGAFHLLNCVLEQHYFDDNNPGIVYRHQSQSVMTIYYVHTV